MVAFLHAQIYLLLQNRLYPGLQSKNRNAYACGVNRLVRLKLSRNYRGPEAYSRRKDYLDHFSVAQVIIARVFSFFHI